MSHQLMLALARFGLGTGASILGGWALFGEAVFQPGRSVFACVSLGALVAAVMALVRARRSPQVIALAIAWSLVTFGLVRFETWLTALSILLFTLGAFLTAVVFDLLGQSGFRFGKFLVVGPLLGGVFLAVAPITEFGQLTVSGSVQVLMFRLFLGLLIGDCVGLGVELAELLPLAADRMPDGEGSGILSSVSGTTEIVTRRDD